MGVPPSHEPAMKQLASNLKAAADAYAASGKDAFTSKNLTLSYDEGVLVASSKRYLKDLGPTFAPRLAQGILTQGMLGGKEAGEIRHVMFGNQAHPFIAGARSQRDDSFFTLSEAQYKEVDNKYAKPGNTCSDFFLVETDNRNSSDRVEVPPPQRPCLPGRLQFGAQWDNIDTPKQLIPGNIMPRSFFQRTDAATMGLLVRDTPITMLGQGCALEMEGMAIETIHRIRGMQTNMQKYLNMEEPPFAKLSSEQLWDLVSGLRNTMNSVSSHLRELEVQVNGQNRRRALHWCSLFKYMGREQAKNGRPGLWSPVRPGEQSEYDNLDSAIQCMMREGSTFAQEASAPPARPQQQHVRISSPSGLLPSYYSGATLPTVSRVPFSPRFGNTGADWDPRTPSRHEREWPTGGPAKPDPEGLYQYDKAEDEMTLSHAPIHRFRDQHIKRASSFSFDGSEFGRRHKSPKNEDTQKEW